MHYFISYSSISFHSFQYIVQIHQLYCIQCINSKILSIRWILELFGRWMGKSIYLFIHEKSKQNDKKRLLFMDIWIFVTYEIDIYPSLENQWWNSTIIRYWLFESLTTLILTPLFYPYLVNWDILKTTY